MVGDAASPARAIAEQIARRLRPVPVDHGDLPAAQPEQFFDNPLQLGFFRHADHGRIGFELAQKGIFRGPAGKNDGSGCHRAVPFMREPENLS